MPSMNSVSGLLDSRATPQQCGALNELPSPSGAARAKPKRSAALENFPISIRAEHPKQCMRIASGRTCSSVHDGCAGSRSKYVRPFSVWWDSFPHAPALLSEAVCKTRSNRSIWVTLLLRVRLVCGCAVCLVGYPTLCSENLHSRREGGGML